jgi:cation/acetate symporter
MAERLRNLGKFTFADIASYRLDQNRIRTFAAIGSLTVVCFYLIVQMVGAGQLISCCSVWNTTLRCLVGVLMMVYVTFGGMTATTWVQIIKACLLLGGGITLMLLTLAQFDWSLDNLFTKAIESHKLGEKLMSPGFADG